MEIQGGNPSLPKFDQPAEEFWLSRPVGGPDYLVRTQFLSAGGQVSVDCG